MDCNIYVITRDGEQANLRKSASGIDFFVPMRTIVSGIHKTPIMFRIKFALAIIFGWRVFSAVINRIIQMESAYEPEKYETNAANHETDCRSNAE